MKILGNIADIEHMRADRLEEWDGRTSAKKSTGSSGVMVECNSKIELSAAYSERLSDDEIADMMAEAARVDAMFQSGEISTMYLVALAAAADASRAWQPEVSEASAA